MVRGFADLLVRDPVQTPDPRLQDKPARGDLDPGVDVEVRPPAGPLRVGSVEGRRCRTGNRVRLSASPGSAGARPLRLKATLGCRNSIAGLIDDIVAGRYLGGPDAGRQPCGDCWACRNPREFRGDVGLIRGGGPRAPAQGGPAGSGTGGSAPPFPGPVRGSWRGPLA